MTALATNGHGHLDVLDGATLFFNDGNHQEDAVLRHAEVAAQRMAKPAVRRGAPPPLVVDPAPGG